MDAAYPTPMPEAAIPFPPDGLKSLPRVASFLFDAKLARTVVDTDTWRYRE